MHFFYLDETGCDGPRLDDPQEPIFVLGGISVKDQAWLKTTSAFTSLLCDYFEVTKLPIGFELHSHELLSPEGDGPFLGHDRGRRNQLALALLDLVEERRHGVHYAAISKQRLAETATGDETEAYDARIPYALAYDYLLTYIEKHVKRDLGHTARGLVILDAKPDLQPCIERITRYRRVEVAKTHRLKWLVEFSYPVDSTHHPMVQLSDLIVYCIRKFYEMDLGHKKDWPPEAKRFFRECFERVHDRVRRKSVVDQPGGHASSVNLLCHNTLLTPSRGWREPADA